MPKAYNVLRQNRAKRQGMGPSLHLATIAQPFFGLNCAHGMGHEPDELGELFAPTTTRRGLIVRAVLFVIGGLLVVYGVLGVILPVLPGFPFLLIGMPLMAASSERARGWMNMLDRKFPLTLRLLLRRMRLEAPPQNADETERARWRRSVLMTVLIWLALAAVGSAVAVASRLAWVYWFEPHFS
jgi:uncharacterized membrane protein YbaN (DUF454 family)